MRLKLQTPGISICQHMGVKNGDYKADTQKSKFENIVCYPNSLRYQTNYINVGTKSNRRCFKKMSKSWCSSVLDPGQLHLTKKQWS